ncbi:hypothetical protein SPRG_15356 [Saprolegnia parasitica CBS 223.65]|uniref:FYVE-type domain-containing protein n=1 Tax=Saprolegnia parasitica (strain CBS 223.65) TaxID=695850 RepID=A0A067BYQ0_SAPPC|nr:hypothetical protein SPRG_15356 [Saprolegnia parasitica CBS 223.65]KDO19451.1 hypothetical protein SPRG_15356 [Saprolegnia parasitica CBS 223.65]|eukprot:XP_012209834.1 hypothetical protein SPRG_15356 [Saprolegnia parasitica CBS 223.65]
MALAFIDNDKELTDTFVRAEKVASTLLSRLQSDPVAVDPSVWPLHNWDDVLWALKQQVLHGPCEEYRGSNEYHSKQFACSNTSKWLGCCGRFAGETRLQKWEKLGRMSKTDAAVKYIRVLSDVVPTWSSPATPDVALLAEWTLDSSSYVCSNCSEGFTLLNRRHHCRRCSRLVCAPCSSSRIGLRLSPGVPQRKQRVCNQCMEQIPAPILKVLATGQEIAPDSKLLLLGQVNDVESTAPSEVDAEPTQDMAPSPALPPATPPKKAAKVTLIKRGYLDRMVGTRFHKAWERFFFVLLIRKGSVGIYLHEDDVTPVEVYKLSGYSIRIKSEKRRPHQFKVMHESNPALRLCAESLRELNAWVAAFAQAIDTSAASLVIRAQDPQ